MNKLCILILISICCQTLKAQDYTVILGEPTHYDNISAPVQSFRIIRSHSDVTAHMFELSELIEPKNTEDYFYFTLYVPGDDSSVDVMVKPGEPGDSLYIDLNNDNDISNDGGPFFFPASEDEFIFELTFNNNPDRKSVRSLLRHPAFALADTSVFNQFAADNYDSDGNLNPERTIYWQRHHAEFTGKRGTFYYSARLSLKRGYLKIGSDSILIGLNDYTANGLYNDEKDRLYLDFDGNGMLSYRNRSEIFNFDEIFEVFGTTMQIHSVDSLGDRISFFGSDLASTGQFIDPVSTVQLQNYNEVYKSELNPDIWNKSYLTLKGDSLHFQKFKNKKVLINFWGEWCKPCYKEMPLLAELNNKHTGKVQIISFLNSGNLSLAKEVIEEQKLNWPHILVNDDITAWFNVWGYPSNFLIDHISNQVISSGGIDSTYVQRFIFR